MHWYISNSKKFKTPTEKLYKFNFTCKIHSYYLPHICDHLIFFLNRVKTWTVSRFSLPSIHSVFVDLQIIPDSQNILKICGSARKWIINLSTVRTPLSKAVSVPYIRWTASLIGLKQNYAPPPPPVQRKHKTRLQACGS